MDKAIFNKIEKLQEQYGITKSVYTTVMLAIIQMDYLQDITQNQTESKEQNRKKLNIDTLCNTVINEIYFNSVLDVDMITNSIDSNISNNILPDVQQFRLLLDTLTYCVARDFKDKLPKDVKFTMPSTGRVAKLENVNLCHCDYSDIKECDYFLGLYKLDLEQRENNFDTFLRDIEKLIQGTFDKIDTLIGSNPRAITGTLYNFNQTMTGIRDAANAFRNLTDYLERHPEAILKGKEK